MQHEPRDALLGEQAARRAPLQVGQPQGGHRLLLRHQGRGAHPFSTFLYPLCLPTLLTRAA